MLPPIPAIFDKKAVLREQMRAERKIVASERTDASMHAARNLLNAIEINQHSIVALYDPIDTELHIEPLYDALIERGVTVCLPVVAKKNAPLIFRRYEDGAPLIEGRYGARTPEESQPEIDPNIIVVPLLAFSRHGDRLGYGGGFYDRTIAKLRSKTTIVTIGYAYGAQQVDALPVSPLDQRLDWIITERSAMRC